MGIELNVNFLFPYFVASPQAFWRNWHISLSTWLRDYLYIPLGGNRGSGWYTTRNLMITMVLGGLWHGAAWTFVLWGAYQGLVLVIGRALTLTATRLNLVLAAGVNWKRVLLGVVMFHVTCYGWLIFRASSVRQVVAFTALLARDLRPGVNTVGSLLWPFLQIVTPLLVVQIYQARKGSELAVLHLPAPVRYAVVGAVCYLILLFADFEGAQFIYFQF
jgi:hypothetical protein